MMTSVLFVTTRILVVILWATVQSVKTRVIDPRGSDLWTNSELKLVHVIFRHGERTPSDTYPRDIYINDTLYPYGWSQLTNKGKRDMFNTGHYLRERYDEFLGELYSPVAVYAQSTWPDRAHMSCALFLAGLWPPKGTPLEWNTQLNWAPIPIKSEPLDEDTLLLARKDCPRYFEELENVYKYPEIKAILDKNQELFEKLSEKTGTNIHSLNDVQSLYSTLDTEFKFGLKLPEWTKEFYPEQLRSLTKDSYIINAYNDELKKLKAGPLLKKLLMDWKSKIENSIKPQERKLFVYSGHDSTITNLLLALGVWDRQVADYGITIIFELLQDTGTKEHGIQIYLRNSTEVAPFPLTIPGCERRCPVARINELIKNVVPADWIAECKAKDPNYRPPLLGEP